MRSVVSRKARPNNELVAFTKEAIAQTLLSLAKLDQKIGKALSNSKSERFPTENDPIIHSNFYRNRKVKIQRIQNLQIKEEIKFKNKLNLPNEKLVELQNFPAFSKFLPEKASLMKLSPVAMSVINQQSFLN